MSERPIWGWTDKIMWLLVVVTGCGAALLYWVGRGVEDVPRESQPPPLVLDVNTVPQGVLLALPRIGPGRAQGIVDERAKRPFQSFEDLEQRVPGIGPTTIAALRPYLTFGKATNGEPRSAEPDSEEPQPIPCRPAELATTQSSH